MTNNGPGFDFLWKLAACWVAGALLAVFVMAGLLLKDAAHMGRDEALSHGKPAVTTHKP